MKIYSFFLLIACLFIISGVHSEEVSEQKAKIVAHNFYFEQSNQYSDAIGFNDLSISNIAHRIEGGVNLYYVFTFNDQGFVIVSAEDVLPPVLGYSLDGFYNEEFANDSYKNFMQSYADAISYVRENKIEQKEDIQLQWNYYTEGTTVNYLEPKDEKSVDPLVYCKWDQGYPYNALCPSEPTGPGGHVYAGCVATAMAQVMYYWRHPMQGNGSHSYYYWPYGTLSANFGETNYDWTGMMNSIDHANIDPIAELQYQCGVAVEMMYGPGGSGAYSWDVPAAMENYFGYSTDCYFASKDDYSNSVWVEKLKDNIDNSWPMYYSGYSTAGGHAFVCDGYQDDYFHFNFGWGGSSDGFYTLLSVNGFNQGQGALFDTYPANSYPNYCNGDYVLTDVSGSIEDGSGPIENYLDNANSTWLIDPQTDEDSISSITLKFFTFDTESNDIVAIYDGETAQENLLGEYSGSEIPPQITSTSNKVLIVFTSDNNVSASGWYVEYKANKPVFCNGTTIMTEPSGSFNDGSGNFNYQNSTVCIWKIEPENAGSVTLSFSSFDTENENDRVLIYDGDNQELLAEYSGSYSPSNLPEPVTSPSGKMFVAFSSGPSIVESGWEASYTSVLTGVENNLISVSEYVVYPNPVSETIHIKIPKTTCETLEIRLLSLDGKIHISKSVNISGSDVNQSLSMRSLLPGIYLLELRTSDQIVYKRIVKN